MVVPVSPIGVGNVKVITQLHNSKSVVCWMTNVLYVPKLTNNLFSVYMQQTTKGNTYKTCCIHQSKKRKVIDTRSSLGKLYRFDYEVQQPSTETAIIAETSIIDLWHQKLANVNLNQLRQLVEYLNSIDIQFQNKPSFAKLVCRESAINNHTIP